MTLYRLTIFAMALLLKGSVFGQAYTKHSTKSLLEDFRVFRGALEESHAGIYWYRTKVEMDKYFDDALHAIDHEMTELEFYRILSPLISKIGCGHTWIATTDPTQDKIWEEEGVLPLKLKFIQRKAYCLENNSTDSLSILTGQEILSINDYSIDSLLSLSNRFSPGDGFIEIGKIKILDNVFNQFYSLFIGLPEEYVIKIKNGGKVETVVMKAVPLKEVEAISKRRYSKKPPAEINNLNVVLLPDRVAVLTVKEFADWRINNIMKDFSDQLRQCFQKIDSAKIKSLVIDLRDNDGGNEKYGLLLYSYLTNKEFVGYKQIDFRTTRFTYRRYSTTSWLQYMFFKTLLKHKKVNDTTYLLTNDKATKVHAPSEFGFRGKTFILINRGTFSTASDFAALAHSNNAAIFVGEETGGSYHGNTSNYTLLITLPTTKIRVNVPLARYQTDVEEKVNFGRGVTPHHTVHYSIDDILGKVDRDMEAVFALIRK
jgi:C-terminal processing protease CtpA/Prc